MNQLGLPYQKTLFPPKSTVNIGEKNVKNIDKCHELISVLGVLSKIISWFYFSHLDF